MNTTLESHNQPESLDDAEAVLKAVKTIAQAGSEHSAHAWLNVWNGRRYYYGERHGRPELAHAEVDVLQYEDKKDSKAIAKAIEEKRDPESCTGTIKIYRLSDVHSLQCFRPGKWVAETIAEAERLASLAVPQRLRIQRHSAAADADFAPFIE